MTMTLGRYIKSIAIMSFAIVAISCSNDMVTVSYDEYEPAFRNPMKGLREFFAPGIDPVRDEYPYPYGTMTKEYMQWNMIEDSPEDGVDKIIAYSNHRWAGVEDINMKVIPRVYLVWVEPWHGGKPKNPDNPDDLNGWHWPSDIPGETWDEDDLNAPIVGGYCDPTFQDRVKKLVAKAGEAWDNDPRVAYIEMGIIGEFGEHHDPDITTVWAPHDQTFHVENRTWLPGIEKVLGDAFTAAFKNKKVMVRYAYEFKDYEFGIYWDSWSQPEERGRGYDEMMKLGDRWKTQPIGGEITWNWGSLAKFRSFEETLADDETMDYILWQIRDLHCNHLGGITWADFNDPEFMKDAAVVQKAMGYRFVLGDISYSRNVAAGGRLNVSFDVVNTGSSPFYYDWPVEIAILDAQTHEKVWGHVCEDVKISQWMPGDDWSRETKAYTSPAPVNNISEKIAIDKNLPDGKYILAIGILDPAGMKPSVRFANENYFEGGYHPVGYIGVGDTEIGSPEIPEDLFFDIQSDKTLSYTLE